MAYNGWSNYETWAVALWLDNDEGSYDFWRERAEDLRDASDLARELKDAHEEAAPDLEGVFGDLLTAALGEVDWYEIAEHYIDDLPEDEEEEDSED